MRTYVLIMLGALVMTSCSAQDETQGSSSIRDEDSAERLALFERRVQILAERMGTPTVECSDRVWPGYSFKDRNIQVVFALNGEERAYLWTPQGGSSTEAYPYADLPPHSRGFYGFITIDQKPAVVLGFDDVDVVFNGATEDQKLDFILDTIVHEGFHRYHQVEPYWAPQHNDAEIAPRGSQYPFEVDSRYYRRMSLTNMREAFATGAYEEHIAKANYWYQKWKAEYPLEYRSYTDRLEGSASYVGMVAKSIAKLGCDVTPAAMAEDWSDLNVSIQVGMDPESYTLGRYAGLLLDQMGHTDWKKRVENGWDPMEILFEDAQAVTAENDSEQARSELTAKLERKQSVVAPFLDPVIAGMTAKEGTVVGLRSSVWRSQVMSLFGFYLPSAFAPDLIGMMVVADTLNYDGAGATDKVTFQPGASLIRFHKNTPPCEGASEYLWVPGELSADQDARIRYNDASIQIDAPLQGSSRYEGLPVVCL